MDDGHHRAPPPTTSVGLCLLPSELLQEIFVRLASPELLRLRSVSSHLSFLVSGDDFRRFYDLHTGGNDGAWLFVLKKRPPHGAVLRGFHDRSGRWFLLRHAAAALPLGEDLYLLAASSQYLVFASNARRELLALDLASRSVHRIPPSPVGPRGTSSWRRSGLTLLADPGRFRFLFAELHQGRAFFFEYRSDTGTWLSWESQIDHHQPARADRDGAAVYLNLVHLGNESVLLRVGKSGSEPVLLRPRFRDELTAVDRLLTYGDGNVAIVRSAAVDHETGPGRVRLRVMTCVEVWGIGSDGREWELVSRVPEELMERIRKPFGVMMGCLEERDGVIRVVLMANCRGSWDLTWLAYDRSRRKWTWVPVPDFGTKGLNMAGLAISSSGFRPFSTVH